MNALRDRFRGRLAARLQEMGLRQSELADLLGVSRPTINQYLSGARLPTCEHVEQIARALDCTIGELLDEHPEPHQAPSEVTIRQWVEGRAMTVRLVGIITDVSPS